MSTPRLTPLNSTLLVVDVQDRLLAKMPDAAGLIRDVAFLVDIANLLQIPVIGTEQYPKGLGPTAAELSSRLPLDLPKKVAFSSCGAPGVLASLLASGRKNIVLAGMETHVCIMQTALDLLAENLNIFLPIDALQARYRLDHDIALRRMEHAGAIITTVEATAFEWLGSADHPHFKAVSKMVQERMAALQLR